MAILASEALLRENKKNPVKKFYPVRIEPTPLITLIPSVTLSFWTNLECAT